MIVSVVLVVVMEVEREWEVKQSGLWGVFSSTLMLPRPDKKDKTVVLGHRSKSKREISDLSTPLFPYVLFR